MNRDTVACRALRVEEIPAEVIKKLAASFDVTPDGCWVYRGYRNEDGYGRLKMPDKRNVYVHRLAAALALGMVPDDREVHHTCHNRSCMNPAHLQLVTGPENEALVAGMVPM